MIDWNKVSELRAEIGDEDFADVVDLFLEEVDGAIEQLRADLPESKLECCLHFLKGSALNLGFTTFSEICAQGEIMARDGATGDINVAEVVAIYDKSKTEFVAGLGDRSDAA